MSQERNDRHLYAQRRAMIDAHKLARGCADCGYNAHPAALTFDHPQGAMKDRRAGRSALHPYWSMARIQAVFASCDVVCANCHAIRTADRGYTGGRLEQAPAPCGSVAAYKRHLRHGEQPCVPCTVANRDRQRASH